MILSKQDEIKLNTLAHGAAAEAVEFLGDLVYKYFAHETVYCDASQKNMNSGKAQLGEWLKALPKGLRDGNAAR